MTWHVFKLINGSRATRLSTVAMNSYFRPPPDKLAMSPHSVHSEPDLAVVKATKQIRNKQIHGESAPSPPDPPNKQSASKIYYYSY